MVRAKFLCGSTTPGPNGIEYTFHAVTASEIPEDQSFSKYTPVGHLSMTVNNPNVKFETGKFYYLDFTPVGDVNV